MDTLLIVGEHLCPEGGPHDLQILVALQLPSLPAETEIELSERGRLISKILLFGIMLGTPRKWYF